MLVTGQSASFRTLLSLPITSVVSILFMLAPLADNGPFGDRRAARRYIDNAADERFAL
jgi:hypothetical protein